ncbi:MAG: flagellar biosynthetic protein FliR [Candidatus Margulisbacteria bacterium]|nr:flagellar biosynthetic protein FliR [Candidatus Margulisiibacteriota bacterium]
MIIPLDVIMVFFLVMARITGIFIQAPVLSARSFPAFGKTALVIWASFVLLYVIPLNQSLPTSLLGFILALILEIGIGYTIGFICNILFLAIQAAGELMDTQMGLSVASALDPVFGAQISVIGRTTFMLALTVFLIFDGHHMILSALNQSFTVLPAGKVPNFASPDLMMQMISLGSALWLSAVKLASPIILMIFLTDFAFGIVSRVAPQVNVFQLGFQLKPVVGLFGISLVAPFLVRYISKLIEVIGFELIKFLQFIK